MGVNHLWSVLAPVKKHKSLDSLRGQMLAVDLSIWICESQAVKQMQGNVIKPFLRNLFFRVNHLLQLGINLVFVIDGCPPKIKRDTIQKRLNHVQNINDNIGDWKKQPYRTRLNAFLRECCCLLECLGIPYVESSGEAESYCAFLNAEGIVDACLTDDGDAFLYGAKEIYRNFTMDSKDPHVESYDIKDIESQLKFNRNHLVAFALLVGCDYLPRGVPKIGVETTLKLFKTLGEKDVLSRFQEWHLMKSSEFSNPVEANVRNKALSLPGFPHEEIIKEFLVPKDKLPKKDLHWKRPNIKKFQEIAVQKLEWTQEYALKKIIPLVTKWTLLEIVGVIPAKHHEEYIVPAEILRTRIKQGIPCFEVKWKTSGTTDESAEKYISIEEQEMFRKCYPYFVEQYSSLQISKSQAKNKESRKKNILVKKENMQPIDTLLLDLEKLSLVPLSETKSCGKESVYHNPDFHTDHIGILQKGTKFTLSCQSASSSIGQQAQHLITSKNDGMLPIELKTNFTPRSDDKYFLTSQKKQQKEFCYSTNNERYVKISPLHDFSTHVCHNTIDENNDENLFSPVFHKLQCRNLLSENKSETIISKGKLFSHSSDVKLRNKQILNSFKVSSQSTPKAHKCHDTKDDKTRYDPEFVFSHNAKISNKSNENSSTDSFILQATQVDYKMEKDQKLLNIASNTLSETLFNDTEMQKNSFSFSKNDSMQLISNNLFTHSTSRSNENFKKVAGNLAFVNVHQQENHDITLSSFNHSQFKQESSILFLNDISLKSNDSVNLNEISSENDINSISINNDIVQCNHSSFLINKNEFKQDKVAPLIHNEYFPVKDNFKISDSSQTTNDCNEITKVGCIFEIKHNLLLDSQKLAYEDDKDLQAYSENHEHFQDGNLTLDKNVISTKKFTDIMFISDCSNESFNEHKSLLGLSSTSSNDSKIISTNLGDQDLLPYSSFENDLLTINAIENTLNNTTLYSFEKNDLGQFDIQTTFLNDSYENQNKY